jgi:hypothetical protein
MRKDYAWFTLAVRSNSVGVPEVPRFDRWRRFCYELNVMISKLATAVMLASALFVASMPLSAAPCILSNTPSEEACEPGCCANKTCCETSHTNTAPPAQPITKSGSDLQNIVVLSATVSVAGLNPATTVESVAFSSAENARHSPAPLALICIRLI